MPIESKPLDPLIEELCILTNMTLHDDIHVIPMNEFRAKVGRGRPRNSVNGVKIKVSTPSSASTGAGDVLKCLCSTKIGGKARDRVESSPIDNRGGKRVVTTPVSNELDKVLSDLKFGSINCHLCYCPIKNQSRPVAKSSGLKTSFENTDIGDVGSISSDQTSFRDGITSGKTGNGFESGMAGPCASNEHTGMEDIVSTSVVPSSIEDGIASYKDGIDFNLVKIPSGNLFGKKPVVLSDKGWNNGGIKAFKSSILSNQFSTDVDRFAKRLKQGTEELALKIKYAGCCEPLLGNFKDYRVVRDNLMRMWRIHSIEDLTKTNLGKIMSGVGKPLVMDKMTKEICLKKADVKYQWKPLLCTHCNTFGHSTLSCKIRPRTEDKLVTSSLKQDNIMSGVSKINGDGNGNGDDGFVTMAGNVKRIFKNPGRGVNQLLEVENLDQGNLDGGIDVHKEFDSKLWHVLKEEVDILMKDVVALNVRSLNKDPNQKQVIQLLRGDKYSLCGLLETHVKKKKIAIGWDPNCINVMVMEQTAPVIHCFIEPLNGDKKFHCSFIYAHVHTSKRRSLWRSLQKYKRSIQDAPWVILSDFNATLDPSEKSTNGSKITIAMGEFRDCVSDINMEDIDMSGLRFTWNKNPGKKGGLLKKLDRVMGNVELMSAFPSAFALNKNNHKPNLTRANPVRSSGNTSIKYYTIRISSNFCSPAIVLPFITYNHTPTVLVIPEGYFMFSLVSKPKMLKRPLRKLNFVQAADPHYDILREPELKCFNAYNVALRDEESFLKQKAKTKWLKEGDRNSKYFHNVVKDPKALFHKKISPTDVAYMVRDITVEEIKCVLFDIDGNKAPVPDGFSAYFLKSSWAVIGEELCKAVKEFFKSGKLLKEINSTVISLVPKNPTPKVVFDYRPIACCNVVYKIISKVIVGRIKNCLGDLVDNNQIVGKLPEELWFSEEYDHIDHGIDCQPLIDRVRKRILDWKNKALLFAVSITNDVERLMRDFLWNFSEFKRGKAKMRWSDVRQPKIEGGLGIRSLKTWNTALISKHIWNLLSFKDSLWRRILKVRGLLRDHIVSKIGDGKGTSLWFDNWYPICPLSNFISKRKIHYFGLSLKTKIGDVIDRGKWNWPKVLCDEFDGLLFINPPILSEDRIDKITWRTNFGKHKNFNVSTVWYALREDNHGVPWDNVIWKRLKVMVKLDHAPLNWSGILRNMDVICNLIKYTVRLRILSLCLNDSVQVCEAAKIWEFHVIKGGGKKKLNEQKMEFMEYTTENGSLVLLLGYMKNSN
ncbi:putative reverse transcriptase domain-containing protein [Tanacetum coccineum]